MGGERVDVRRARLGLYSHHACFREERLHRNRHAGGQAAPAEWHDHEPNIRHILRDLEPDSALTGHHLRIVERVHNDPAVAARQLVGGLAGLVVRALVEDHLAAVLLHGSDLRQRRPVRHHGRGADAELSRGEGHTLCVVARARCHNPGSALCLA